MSAARTRRAHLMRENHRLRAEVWLEENRELLRQVLYDTMSPAERELLNTRMLHRNVRRQLVCLN